MTEHSILIVDDEISLAKNLVRLFAQESWNAECVFSGTAALDHIRARTFDVVLLDMKMPHLDGFQTLEQLLQINPEQCVVFYTGFGDVQSAVKSLRMGAWIMVMKGLRFEELFEQVVAGRRQCAERNELRLKKEAAVARELDMAEAAVTQAQAFNHQIKTRLAVCGLELSNIEEAETLPEVRGYAKMLREDIERAVATVKRVSDIFRRENEYFIVPPPIEPQNIHRGVEDGFHFANRLVTRRNQKVSLKNQVDDGIQVLCHAGRLSDVFEECFVNSIQAAFEKNLVITVSTKMAPAADTTVIRITDDGLGFSDDVISKAHLPYVTTKRGKGGSGPAQNFGLGMHIVKTIIEGSGGTMSYGNLATGGAYVEIVLKTVHS